MKSIYDNLDIVNFDLTEFMEESYPNDTLD